MDYSNLNPFPGKSRERVLNFLPYFTKAGLVA